MTAHRPAPMCLTLTGALAALALVASTWTLPADVSTAAPARSAQPVSTSAPAVLAQAPMDVPDDALPASVLPSQAATPADPAPAGEGAPGLLYVLALLGTGLAAACRRDGA